MTTRKFNCGLRQRTGAAAAELALWLPFLGLMFVVAVDFCRVYYVTQVIQNCACAGAMYASGASAANPGSASDPVVQAVLAEGVSLNPPLTSANVATATAGGTAQVSVTYDFPLIAQWPGCSGTVTITRSVSMAVLPAAGS